MCVYLIELISLLKVIRLLMTTHLTSSISYIDFSRGIFDRWHCLQSSIISTAYRIGSTNIKPVHRVLNTRHRTVWYHITSVWYTVHKRCIHLSCSSAWIWVQIQLILAYTCTFRAWCRWILAIDIRHRVLLIIIKHMCQDIFGIFQSLCHFSVITIESLIKWHSRSLSFFIDIGYIPILRIQEYLSMILEINLYYFIA